MTRCGSIGCSGATTVPRSRAKTSLTIQSGAQDRAEGPWRGIGAPIGQIDDLALVGALDRGIRFVDEAFEALGQW